jgi:hypothetical protein
MMWRLHLKDRFMRRFYCSRGLHRLITGGTEVSNSKGLRLKTQFIRCIYCETHFFTNDKNKDHYRRIREREKSDFSKFINIVNLKENTGMSKRDKHKLMAGRLKIKEFNIKPHKRKRK